MLQCLVEVVRYPGAIWSPYNVQKQMGPETIVTMVMIKLCQSY